MVPTGSVRGCSCPPAADSFPPHHLSSRVASVSPKSLWDSGAGGFPCCGQVRCPHSGCGISVGDMDMDGWHRQHGLSHLHG